MTAPSDQEQELDIRQPEPEMAFIATELQQSNEGFRLQMMLSVQIITVLVVANATIKDLRERTARLRKVKGSLIGTGRGIIRALLVVVAIAEVAAALVLSQFFGWRMF